MKNALLQLQLIFCRFQNTIFIVKISEGVASKVSGNLKSMFLHECNEIIKRHGVQTGIVYAVKDQYGSTSIKAFGGIPTDVLQQLRNVWHY